MEKVGKIFWVSWVILVWIYSLTLIFAGGIFIVNKEVGKGLFFLVAGLITNSLLIKWDILIKENETKKNI